MENENGLDPNAGAASAVEAPAPQTNAQEAQPNEDGVIEGKSYTAREVSEIVRNRVKGWQEFGKPEELKGKLSRYEQMEKWANNLRQQFGGQDGRANGQNPPAPETDQDRQVRQYIERLYPGMQKWQDERQQLANYVQSLDAFRWQTITEKNSTFLRDQATKDGYKPEQLDQIEEHVKNSIMGNQEDLKAYLTTGNRDIVKKHFDAVNKWIKSFGPPTAPTASAADLAKNKAKLAGLAPRMPSGGVSAPTSGKKKLGEQERITAAWEAFSKGNAA